MTETRDNAVSQAFTYLPFAAEDLPRQHKEWLPTIRCFGVAIDAALDEGQFEEALRLAEEAVALGLGKVYEQKADSIRWMM